MHGTVPRARELGLVAATLAVALLLQVVLTRSTILFGHVMWLDEILTWTIANDTSFSHAIAAVRGGVETNPPTVYLLLWPIAKLSGGLNEIGLRAFAFTSIVIALVGIYVICRVRFSPLASLVGTLVVAAHPLVVRHMFEARFYGPWLAATVWYAWLTIRLRGRQSIGLAIVTCLVAVLAATMHYFAIIAVLLIWVISLLLDRRSSRSLNALPPIIAIIAALACIPFILGQRAGLHVRTWIDPASLSDVKDILVSVYGPPSLLLVVFAVWFWRVMRGPRDAVDSTNPSAHDLRALAPITSLLVFPLIIIAFSYLLQPALMERYFIIAVAPLACLAAYAASRSPAWVAGGALLGVLVIGSAEIMARARAVRGLERDMGEMIDEIERVAPPEMPLVFKRRVEMYPLVRVRPDLLDRAALLDFEPAHDADLRPFSIYERDMARKFAAFYPRYRLVNLAEVREPLALVVPPDAVERDEASTLFPADKLQARGSWILEISGR